MIRSYAILPCNGLDKCAGCITQEIALLLSEQSESQIICPVFYCTAEARYTKLVQELPLLVVDGCATRCASKLATEKNLKISDKLIVTDEAKSAAIELSESLRINDEEKQLARKIVDRLLKEPKKQADTGQSSAFFPSRLDYELYQKDKFIFRVPTNKRFYFNENDVWVYVSGNKARIGVTDYVQKSLSDIIFVTLPSIGLEVEQFDGAGEIESGKAVFEIISPVSGTITTVNDRLMDKPELINENPYEQGWLAEIELSDFEADKDLLHEFDDYFPILKRKADEYNAKS